MSNRSWLHGPARGGVLGMCVLSFSLSLSLSLAAQTQPVSGTGSQPDPAASSLESRIADIDENLHATRAELEQSREEIRQLRMALERLEERLAASQMVP